MIGNWIVDAAFKMLEATTSPMRRTAVEESGTYINSGQELE